MCFWEELGVCLVNKCPCQAGLMQRMELAAVLCPASKSGSPDSCSIWLQMLDHNPTVQPPLAVQSVVAPCCLLL